jgi:dipeptidyl aminopeptidase/acylaminoacyl peptidase
VLLAEFADVPAEIIELTPGHRRLVRSSAPTVLEPAWVSHAEPVQWPGSAGEVQGWFYQPTAPAAAIADGEDVDGAEAPELPPLIVLSHGGPTAFSTSGFDPGVQFWTTRGFAVLDVNYSGSSGYGRAYRDRLRGEWGVLDVHDCIAGAEAMAMQGRVDGERLAIRGGSAGGYTTLRALTTSTIFAAGCSRYGIGDLTALATDTHKFESRYLHGLIGPWPDAAELYRERSPINHVDALNCPMLILQGAEDAVVPPNQAETMAKAVAAKGLDVELIVFEGEGHGFRRVETVERALEAELAFYQRVFGLS